MKLLGQNNYDKLIIPLKEVTINNLFARSVIEKKVRGKVYVDDPDEPKTYHIVHPYGVSLLFGAHTNFEFNAKFREYALNLNKLRNKSEWMQASPDNWHLVLNELFKGYIVQSSENQENAQNNIVETNTRVNFKFNPESYLIFKKAFKGKHFNIIRTNKSSFEEMEGSVIPRYFWNNADDFCKNGLGFSLFENKKLASTAFSAFIFENKLEIGIETLKEFKGKGFAQYTCAALIDYCLENNYEPVWSCKYENTASFQLAKKLGFEPTKMVPFYKLP
jgi:hypothetical protein